ncbi:Acetyl-coenzyme A synthetase [Penicillium diatomitis]|uniref:Acetyl-coenzyme A synthetase n=1 Tax=Penicillium diatomitis TaxID=2819901 RepID=A0A9X0BNY3_9EURO|nr:Acetyl-coenzyme A synthetase [Penicillium diatomitis]KAJ5475722.1 Acetyl-coenzyme A synthetase [Penicillium diatomitis]
MRCILRNILEGETQQFGDISTPDSKDGTVSSPDPPYPHPYPVYELTFLDHILPPCHMFIFLSFGKASIEGIDALRRGVKRLSKSLQFLTGVSLPSGNSGSEDDAFHVQPADSAFLQRYPMLKMAFSSK